MESAHDIAVRLAANHLNANDPLGWFEPLYNSAAGDPARIPWADLSPNPNLLSWLKDHPPTSPGTALVVGCGLGDDAEELARIGFRVTAFDISQTAIDWCHRRFPKSSVKYIAANLLNPPSSWHHAFDFIFEAYTLQAMPRNPRRIGISQIVNCLSNDGELLIVARGREDHEPEGSLPWPLTRTDLAAFEQDGLALVSFEDYLDSEQQPVRRFRATYKKPA